MEMLKKPKIEKRTFLVKLFLIIGLLIICGLFPVFLILGGYIQGIMCRVVYKGSYLYNQFSCLSVTELYQEGAPISGPEGKYFDRNYENEGELVARIVEEIETGVVGVGVSGDNFAEEGIIGTGFLISGDGIIVTNKHVVEQSGLDYYISFKNVDLPVKVPLDSIFLDPVNDIALIKIQKSDVPSEAKVLEVGDSDVVKLGETVIAIGNPLGKFTGTITKGIISGLNREVNISSGFFNTQSEVYEDVIQTDAAINPGNSGGPLLNLNAQVIGINFATIEGASNLSFALPINRIKSRLLELKEFGKFRIPFLGVEYRTRLVFIKGQSFIGAEVIKVVENGPADISGLLPGDIIVDFAGENFENNSLSSLIQKQKIGDEVNLVIIRNKQEKEIKVTIGER